MDIGSSSRKDFTTTFLIVVIYAIAFYSLQFLLHAANIFPLLPTTANLKSWDADWYRNIADNGYLFSDKHQSNTGFFVLLLRS